MYSKKKKRTGRIVTSQRGWFSLGFVRTLIEHILHPLQVRASLRSSLLISAPQLESPFSDTLNSEFLTLFL